ncbi:MAG: hypothetical protein ACREF9_10705 [Opitutaceae bacterium]
MAALPRYLVIVVRFPRCGFYAAGRASGVQLNNATAAATHLRALEQAAGRLTIDDSPVRHAVSDLMNLDLHPDIRLRKLSIGAEGAPLLVIDNVMNDADALVDHALESVSLRPLSISN